MNKIIKKNVVKILFIVILIDLAIGYSLLKSRLFSHLSLWNIIESDKKEDFYWPPENAPGYFHFEPDNKEISIFRDEIFPLIKDENDEFRIALKAARYIGDIKVSRSALHVSRLRWDSPGGMLKQIREGAKGAHCFHRAILFSTYLSSLGMKSRLWALENKKFDGVAHTVSEVYIKDFKKWVFIDVMLGFYVTGGEGNPLSCLELREKLLHRNAAVILVHSIDNENGKRKELPKFYNRLIKCLFLRTGNDFVNKYDNRYGRFSALGKIFDKFPDTIRRGLEYLLGGQNIFVHYVDKFSRSLRPMIIIAKLFFYFFIISLAVTGIQLARLFLSFLKYRLAINFSKKEVRHR